MKFHWSINFLGKWVAVSLLGAGLVACGYSADPSTTPQLSLFAGDYSQSNSVDGTGAQARFSAPTVMTKDSTGNLYVADLRNSTKLADGTIKDFPTTIRKIRPDGVVTSIPYETVDVGVVPGRNCLCNSKFEPQGLAVDSKGNLFVSDFAANMIRKITPSGTQTIFAGTNVGSADGIGTAASFNGPAGMAIDSQDNLYVSDTSNGTIRKISPAGQVTTFTPQIPYEQPNKTGSSIPWAMTIDANGNLYVVYVGEGVIIRKITPQGVVTKLAGNSSVNKSVDGAGASAGFNIVIGITADASGNLYVTEHDDTASPRIRKITSAGVVTTVAGRSSGQGYLLPDNMRPYGIVSLDSNTLAFSSAYAISKLNLP